MFKRLLVALAALTILATACGGDDNDATAANGDAAEAASDEAAGSVTGPASVSANDQTGDGTTVTVASVTLPTDGFVVIHATNNGAPGTVIGNSHCCPQAKAQTRSSTSTPH